MEIFEEREKGFEAKHHNDQERLFKIHARRDKLLGLWAAGAMRLEPAMADGYARTIVEIGLSPAGLAAVLARLREDLTSHHAEDRLAELTQQCESCESLARQQLESAD